MKKVICTAVLGGFVLTGCGKTQDAAPMQEETSRAALASDPANATYVLDADVVALVDGKASRPAAPGSAERMETRVFGTPVAGDLDGDGDEDAALILIHRTGGSGSFYYLAAAIREAGGYRGTNAIFLGDRIAPQKVEIRNGVVLVNYADRLPGEPMTSSLGVRVTQYVALRDGELKAAEPFAPGMQWVEGWITLGHEVREFKPCDGQVALWLDPSSPAFQAIKVAYDRTLRPGGQPYSPVFMTLSGQRGAPPKDGFGREYEGSFLAGHWLQVWPRGSCKPDQIQVSAPAAGDVIQSPLLIRGRASGKWFFEGDFPIHLKDAGGHVLATAIAKAKGPWMTQEFVPFEARLEFKPEPQPRRGTLVLVKDNPSDDRSLDDAVELPVFYQ